METDPLIVICVWLLCIVAFFITAIIAGCRHHHNSGAIFVMNLFLGITGIGWIVALIWATTAVRHPAAPVMVQINGGVAP